MRSMHILKLPDGSTIQALGSKHDSFWQDCGVAKGTDLTSLKPGHAKRIMKVARIHFPDQVKAEEVQHD